MTNLFTLPGTFLGHTWKQDSLFGLDSQSLSSEQWGKLAWAQAGTAAGLRWGELRGPSLHAAQMGPVTPDWPCQPVPVLSLTYSRDLGRPGQGWPEDLRDKVGCMPPAPLGLAGHSPEALHGFQGGPLGETRPLSTPLPMEPRRGRGGTFWPSQQHTQETARHSPASQQVPEGDCPRGAVPSMGW